MTVTLDRQQMNLYRNVMLDVISGPFARAMRAIGGEAGLPLYRAVYERIDLIEFDEIDAETRRNQIGTTTVKQIQSAGGTVTPDPIPGNPGHCLVGGVTANALSSLLTTTIPNPCK